MENFHTAASRILSSEVYEDMGRRRGQRTGNLTDQSGSWILRWREDSRDVLGRPKRQQVSMVIGKSVGPNKMTKRQAEREAWDRVLSKLDAAALKPAALITLQQFVTSRFIPDHVEMTLKPGGKDHYEYCLKHIVSALGNERLRDFNSLMLQDFLNTKKRVEKLSPQTLKHLKNALSAIFRYAKTCGVWAGDLPTEGLKLPPIVEKEKKVLNEEQAIRLIQSLKGQYATLGALMLSTGLRVGEAAGLKWKRIDFAARRIMVRESWSREHGYQEPKTEKGKRDLPLPDALIGPLLALRNGADDESPVFVTTKGNPIDKRTTASKILKPAAKRAGVPWMNFHLMRHTNATLTDQTLTETERMKLLGHSSRKMTSHYTHPEMERARNAIEGIAEAMVQPEPKGPVN